MADLDAPTGWWPVDKVLLAYMGATALLTLAYYRSIPGAWWMLAAEAAAALLLVHMVRRPYLPGARAFRHWYPLPYVAACYKQMSVLIPAIRGPGFEFDQQLAQWDRMIWGVNPTVWLEQVTQPWLTETLQMLYALFVPAVLLPAGLLWARRRYAEFRYYAFLVSLGFLVSYLGYLAVPARGPRFLLAGSQHMELAGLVAFAVVRRVLDVLESAHFDCFPSGHMELTIIAWWGSRHLSSRLFRVYLVYTLSIVFATVYLRYHYTVDIAAGALVAGLLLISTPFVYRGMGERVIGRR